jgi:hypothetical protein
LSRAEETLIKTTAIEKKKKTTLLSQEPLSSYRSLHIDHSPEENPFTQGKKKKE